MREKLIFFRGLLERNKIFFEVLVASTLTFMGVYVSIQANTIATNQTKIMEQENTPKIEIRQTQLYNDSTKIYDITKWLVFNHNSKISNFDIEKEISYLNLIKRGSYLEINLPLRSYLNLGGTLTGESEGLIFDFDNRYTGYNEYLTRQKIWNYGHIQPISFVELSYENVLEKKEKRYYQITPRIREINKTSWDSLITDWSNKSQNAIYIDSNIDENIERIKTSAKKISQ